MLHRHRVWCVTPVASAEELAEKLTGTTWTACTAFEIGGHDVDDIRNHEYGEYYHKRNPLTVAKCAKKEPGI